jgi:hypothetical protein
MEQILIMITVIAALFGIIASTFALGQLFSRKQDKAACVDNHRLFQNCFDHLAEKISELSRLVGILTAEVENLKSISQFHK